MRSPNSATDRLIHAARTLVDGLDWHLDTASDHGHADACCQEAIDVVSEGRGYLSQFARVFTHYSDGRPIDTVVSVDDGAIVTRWLWPANATDLPADPFETGRIPLAPHRRPGDRGHVVVTFDPRDFTASATFVPALGLVGGRDE